MRKVKTSDPSWGMISNGQQDLLTLQPTSDSKTGGEFYIPVIWPGRRQPRQCLLVYTSTKRDWKNKLWKVCKKRFATCTSCFMQGCWVSHYLKCSNGTVWGVWRLSFRLLAVNCWTWSNNSLTHNGHTFRSLQQVKPPASLLGRCCSQKQQ